MTKLYKVEFMEYTNGLRDQVWSEREDKYVEIKDLIIPETDLEYYSGFGGGFRKLEYVGLFPYDQKDFLVIIE